jgi:hypothetical protein
MVKTIFIYCINIILVGLLIAKVIAVDNDKGILLFLFYYFLLAVLNLIVGTLLKFRKHEIAKAFGDVLICMIILVIPISYLLLQWE